MRLPLSWDDPAAQEAVARYAQSVRADAPWCPSNIEFIRRINGLDSEDEVKRIVFDATYLVLGLGDVYLGAPVATPLDPAHRLVTTKYNPARTWTPENAVGIGGAYLCVYGMEGPGGYQLVGRTIPVWSTGGRAQGLEDGLPWLLRPFDRIRFEPVSHDELTRLRDGFHGGATAVAIEPGTLRPAAHAGPLDAAADAFATRRAAAFAAERAAWEEAAASASDAPAAAAAASAAAAARRRRGRPDRSPSMTSTNGHGPALAAAERALAAIGEPDDQRVWISRVPAETLRERARRLDAAAAAGASLPLHGTTFAVKDNLDVAGLPTTAACPAYAYEPTATATVVARLEAAGALLVGKTNLDQFATGVVGTRSPYGAPSAVDDRSRISGGSSSGSAVAVARGEVDFSLGTDTAGSGRVPAAFNGLVGTKPSRGLLSTIGLVPACRSLDCVSIFTADARLARAVLDVADAHDAHDAYSRADRDPARRRRAAAAARDPRRRPRSIRSTTPRAPPGRRRSRRPPRAARSWSRSRSSRCSPPVGCCTTARGSRSGSPPSARS